MKPYSIKQLKRFIPAFSARPWKGDRSSTRRPVTPNDPATIARLAAQLIDVTLVARDLLAQGMAAEARVKWLEKALRPCIQSLAAYMNYYNKPEKGAKP